MLDANRSAIVVIPKQPLLDWLQFADPEGDDLTLEMLREDPTVYLIRACGDAQEVRRVLEECCTTMFEEQLDAWITDDTLWPMDRSFEVFCRWFAVSFHSVVYDLSEGQISERPLTAGQAAPSK
jgi:hypothetical protein